MLIIKMSNDYEGKHDENLGEDTELDKILSEIDEFKPKANKKKSKDAYYLDKAEFRKAIAEYYVTENCTHYLGDCLIRIAEGLSYNSSFINYCVDEQTEALTRRGWLKYNELTLNDIILSYNVETKALVWSAIKDIFVGQHNDLMFKLTVEGLDALVTPNHKFVSLEDGIKPIEEFNTDDHLVLMGDYVQTRSEPLSDYMGELLKTSNRNLKLETILSLSQEERLILISSIVGIDNTFKDTDKSIIDNFVILCTISGFSTITNYDEISREYMVMYAKTKRIKSLKEIDLNGSSLDSLKPTVHYNGTIWCPQTEYGTWVCRRGKAVYVTGNSYKEDMIGDAMIKMYSALKRKKFDVESPTSPFGYFTTIAFHAFINRIKKEKKHHEALTQYRQIKYEQHMAETEGHVYVKPIIDSTGDDGDSFESYGEY